MELIDIGINLAHDSYDTDREAVLQRGRDAGVVQMIVTGSSEASTRSAIALARKHPRELFATAGVHPHHASDWNESLRSRMHELGREVEVVAIGECGLDYFRDLSPRAAQRAAFIAQLLLADALGKPVFLHQRDAHADFTSILREHARQLRGAVAHCFTGTEPELEQYLELGLFIGITGWICDERRGRHLLELVHRIPADRLLVETDGPYLLPRDLVPKPASRRNEPAYLPHIVTTVAKARGEQPAITARTSTAAARALFGLPTTPMKNTS
jgi:TatD DNase family protein